MARRDRNSSEAKNIKASVRTIIRKPGTRGRHDEDVGRAGSTPAPPRRMPQPPDPPEEFEQPRAPQQVSAPAADLPMDLTAASAAVPYPHAAVSAPPENVQPQAESAPLPALLFEIGWEVCWQLGGIYTVLRSKADAMIDRWDDRYCLIGPYNPATAPVEFEERPSEGLIRDALDRLREQGVPCHFGRWLVPGRPRVILLDYRARYRHLDHDKYLLWKDHGISADAGDGEVNEVTAFGFTVTEFFRALAEVAQGRTILAHFHEWMAGVAVPRIAHLKLPVVTIFTTHATILGRYLASDMPDFYNQMSQIRPDEMAAKYLIWPKFAIERAAAHASTVFTTVSEVTAGEAATLLGRQPDAILPNGLNIRKFAALHEFQNLHRQYKERIHEFVMGHFFPSYTFDLDNTLYLFTSGRYEYRNKGMDLFIEALHRLNQRLRGLPAMFPRPTVVAFIITRAATRSINVGVLQNQSMFDELSNTCLEMQEQMGRRLFQSAATGRIPTYQELLPDDAQVRLKRAMHAWRSSRQPTIVTHDLVDDAGDPILKHLRHRGMFNAADDPVKMVFHPEFVTATGPLINLDYEQFVRGCHLGIFPSYYEPWGYTPMESIAMGVPAVTTDLSGFGAYVQRHIANSTEHGVLVLNRRTRSFEQSAEDLTAFLFDFVRMSRRTRIELRNRTERLSEHFDWSVLVRHYHEAHDLAMQRVGARKPGAMEVRLV
jgi:glycogen(starch) synthase